MVRSFLLALCAVFAYSLLVALFGLEAVVAAICGGLLFGWLEEKRDQKREGP